MFFKQLVIYHVIRASCQEPLRVVVQLIGIYWYFQYRHSKFKFSFSHCNYWISKKNKKRACL